MNSLLNNATPEKTLVLYFQVHQPRRLRDFRFFDIGAGGERFDDHLNRAIVQRIARECYVPTNELLLDLIDIYPQIRVTFSLSGTVMDQLDEYAPEALDSFRKLALTGCVEFLSETHYHSMSCMMPGSEFEEQVMKHAERLNECLGVRPCTFRNTELIYSDDIGRRIGKLGFTGVLIDGVSRIPLLESPNHVYHHPDDPQLMLLTRNYPLSDEIAFRYLTHDRRLTVKKFMDAVRATPPFDPVITLGMDYETFGEHQKRESGIFSFFGELIAEMAKAPDLRMATASMAMIGLKARGPLSVPHFISWADNERDLSAWLGNDMQRDAFDSLVALEYEVKNTCNPTFIEEWRNLQASDHFYYMSTKKGTDGSIHSYFSPYASPYEAFINYMNVITDFTTRLRITSTPHDELARQSEQTAQPGTSSRMTMLVE